MALSEIQQGCSPAWNYAFCLPPSAYRVPGRWMSPDPLGGDLSNPQSLNRYAYVMNNPTTLTDPTGLQRGCAPGQANCRPPSCTNMNCAAEYYCHSMYCGFTSSSTQTCTVDGVSTSCDYVFAGMRNGSLYPLPPPDQGWRPVTQQADCPGCEYNAQDQTWDPDDPRTWGGNVYMSTLSPAARTVFSLVSESTSGLTTAKFWGTVTVASAHARGTGATSARVDGPQ